MSETMANMQDIRNQRPTQNIDKNGVVTCNVCGKVRAYGLSAYFLTIDDRKEINRKDHCWCGEPYTGKNVIVKFPDVCRECPTARGFKKCKGCEHDTGEGFEVIDE